MDLSLYVQIFQKARCWIQLYKMSVTCQAPSLCASSLFGRRSPVSLPCFAFPFPPHFLAQFLHRLKTLLHLGFTSFTLESLSIIFSDSFIPTSSTFRPASTLKLNLREKCVNNCFVVFLWLLPFFFGYRHFSLFFIISSFSLFFIVFHHPKIYLHSELKQSLQTSSAVISNIYSNFVCSTPFPSFLVFENTAFQLLITKYCCWNETCLLRINFVVFWGAYLSQNVLGGTFEDFGKFNV